MLFRSSSGRLLAGLTLHSPEHGNGPLFFLPEIGPDGTLKKEQFDRTLWVKYLSDLGGEAHGG